MARDVNNVVLIGRLTRDAEMKHFGGSAKTEISIAVNNSKKVGERWEDEPSFFDVDIWGKTAEAITQYLKKGKQIGVSGKLVQERWEKEGQKRSKVKIHADSIQLLSDPRRNSEEASSGYSHAEADSSSSVQTTVSTGSTQVPESFEDDIPF